MTPREAAPTPRPEIQELAAWLRAQCPNYAMQERCETCGYSKAARIVEQYDPEALVRLTAENERLRSVLERFHYAYHSNPATGGPSCGEACYVRAALAGTP